MSKINNNIEILSKYGTCSTKIKCKCKVCGYEWESVPDNLLQGKGCIKCYHKRRALIRTKTPEHFVKEMHEINPNVEVIGEYSGAKTKIKCKCLIHNEIFSSLPTHLLQGKIGCKACASIKRSNNRMKTHKQFVDDLKRKNNNIKVIGQYNGSHNKIQVKCLKCNHIWNPQADSLLQGTGCPKCTKSKGEIRIEEFLIDNGIKYESQKKFSDLRNTNPLSYDFFLPDFNALIEYQGQFHDGSTTFVDKKIYFERQKTNDKIKKEYATNNSYILLEIWYYDYDNIEKILENFIYNLKNPVTTTVA